MIGPDRGRKPGAASQFARRPPPKQMQHGRAAACESARRKLIGTERTPAAASRAVPGLVQECQSERDRVSIHSNCVAASLSLRVRHLIETAAEGAEIEIAVRNIEFQI